MLEFYAKDWGPSSWSEVGGSKSGAFVAPLNCSLGGSSLCHVLWAHANPCFKERPAWDFGVPPRAHVLCLRLGGSYRWQNSLVQKQMDLTKRHINREVLEKGLKRVTPSPVYSHFPDNTSWKSCVYVWVYMLVVFIPTFLPMPFPTS